MCVQFSIPYVAPVEVLFTAYLVPIPEVEDANSARGSLALFEGCIISIEVLSSNLTLNPFVIVGLSNPFSSFQLPSVYL